MHPTDPLSTNLFARLFAYTPRSDARKPIEDFCTEALAWCLLSSKKFCEKFLELLKIRLSEVGRLRSNFGRFGDEIDVGTQISFRADPEDEEAGDEQDSSRGRFDMMIRPIAGQSFLLVIESKVSFDKGMDSQIDDYIRVLDNPKLPFARYVERYVVSLTPWTPDISQKCARLNWQDVHRLLEEEAAHTPNSIVRQFSEFLEHRNLSSLKLMKLETKQIGQLKSIAPFFGDVKNLFGRFQNEPKLKAIFKKHWERPVIDYDEESKDVTYGIYSGYRNPWVYAGFNFKQTEIILYIQFNVDGDCRSWSKEFREGLAEAAKEASRFGYKPEIEDKWTCFYFFKRLTPDLADSPDRVFAWFKATIEAGDDFFGKKIRKV